MSIFERIDMKLYRVYLRGQIIATTYAESGWDAIVKILLSGVYAIADINAHEVEAEQA